MKDVQQQIGGNAVLHYGKIVILATWSLMHLQIVQLKTLGLMENMS